MPPALILLSGGLDSATCLAIAADAGHAPLHTLAFDYGQRHRHELQAARALAQKYGAIHREVRIDLRQFGGSALTADIDVPKHDTADDISTDIPVTYVPARNTLFLSFALAECEVSGINDVYIGVNALDYSGYPDCRPEFIDAFQQTARLGTKLTTLTIHAPLVHWTKAQIIRRGTDLGVDYALTHSCYDPINGKACGRCDSCLLRAKGFRDAGVPDPTDYA
ncbi:MAG: 7-cyano-7-deazaguanine synthase QueC [Planctomycetota bacterium]